MSILPFARTNMTELQHNAFGAIVMEENRELHGDVRYLLQRVEELEESMLQVSDAFDSIGWSPLPEKESQEIPLKTVKKIASVARAVTSVNPFVKRGVNARIQYVWGKGVNFDGVDSIQDTIDNTRRKLFSTQAYEELERVLATDGNAFTALPIDPEGTDTQGFPFTPFRIKLDEVVNAISNPNDYEDIWYYKRSYTIYTTQSDGSQKEKEVTKYYASLNYYRDLQKRGKSLPKRYADAGVEQNYVIHHLAVNKQVGWRWGLPDVTSVLFWAKAYKEYLEDNASLVKAYSRLAWSIKSPGATNGVGAQIMAPPTRDPVTGENRSVGGAAAYGPGFEVSPIAATGSSVDFTKGAPLAAAIAAGLEVSVVVITSDVNQGSNATAQSLDLPTLKAMESRQKLHTDRFLDILEFFGAKITGGSRPGGTDPNKTPQAKKRDVQEASIPNTAPKASARAEGTDPKKGVDSATAAGLEKQGRLGQDQQSGVEPDLVVVTWPQIMTDTTKDRVTAVSTAIEEGILFKQEGRKEILDILGVAPYKPWDVLPTMADDPAAQEQFEQQQLQAQQAAEQEAKLAETTAVAKQGVSGGVAARGGSQTSNNESRQARRSDKNNNG